MKNFLTGLFLSLLMLLFGTGESFATVPHGAEIKKESALLTALPQSASPKVKIAGIYWLPDYLKDNVSRDYNSNASDDKGGGDKVKVCSDYGFISPSDLDLDVYTCSSYDTVPVHGLSCYNSCKCKPGFTYTSANCNTSAGYVLSGKSCEGKYQSCTCSKECCSDSMCRSNQSCVSGVCVNNDPCANVTCGTDETCSNGSCVSTCTYTLTASDCKKECKNPSSSSCTRSGSTYYASCGASTCTAAQTCSSGSCLDNCTNTITASYCASQCKDTGSSSCTRDGTTYYASCGASKCGSNQSCSSGSCVDNCTPLADETGCGIRGTKSCSNNCGGYRQCCKTAKEYCEENGYSSGITCQTGQTTESCSADSSYKKCTGSACPSSKTCTYGCKTYSSQSGCSNVCTVCYDDNCRNQTAITPPVNATCSSYYSDCSSKCQAWSCNSGYYKDGNSCTSNDCKVTPVTPPANATCSSKNSCDICTGWTCNSGYNKSGSSCVCATTCADKITSKPENSTYVTESCTACGTTTNIRTGWTCDNGYNQSGNSCVATHVHSYHCKPGYQETNQWGPDADIYPKVCDCGQIGQGTQCYRCMPLSNQSNCQYGTMYCDNGCGGARICCQPKPDEPEGCTPKVGYIMYADGTCSQDLKSGKTPIGIISALRSSSGISTMLIVALTEKEYTPWSRTQNINYSEDIPDLTNYRDSSTAIQDWNGSSNTSKIVSFASSNGKAQEAASYCSNLTVGGVSNWFLPAAGQLQDAYTNKTAITTGLNKISSSKKFSDLAYYWSSSEYPDGSAWAVMLNGGYWMNISKYITDYGRGGCSVRCMRTWNY